MIRVPSPMSHGKSCFDCFCGHNKEKKALQTAASFAGKQDILRSRKTLNFSVNIMEELRIDGEVRLG